MILDHVGVAVSDLSKACDFYRNALGLELIHQEKVLSQGVNVAFLSAGQTSIELLEPIDQNGVVAQFISKRGAGLHHIAFQTASIGMEMKRLNSSGFTTLEKSPRPGARGHQVCFLHPKQCHGSLVEIIGG